MRFETLTYKTSIIFLLKKLLQKVFMAIYVNNSDYKHS